MERKKIVPKNKFNASQQEELLEKLQQNQANTVITQNFTATTVKEDVVTYPQAEAVILQQKTDIAVKNSNDTVVSEKTGKTQRITVDMPLELYERMKDEVDDNGQTIKGFVVNLVKSHFSKK